MDSSNRRSARILRFRRIRRVTTIAAKRIGFDATADLHQPRVNASVVTALLLERGASTRAPLKPGFSRRGARSRRAVFRACFADAGKLFRGCSTRAEPGRDVGLASTFCPELASTRGDVRRWRRNRSRLRAHEAELHAEGVSHMFRFRSVARGEADEKWGVLRHDCRLSARRATWNVIATDLAPLEAALPRMLAQIGEE